MQLKYVVISGGETKDRYISHLNQDLNKNLRLNSVELQSHITKLNSVEHAREHISCESSGHHWFLNKNPLVAV